MADPIPFLAAGSGAPPPESGLTALLLAGRRPGVDPLAAAHGETLKALIPVAGRPMAARVADMLLACPEVAAVRVLTQDVDALRPVLPADPRLAVLRSADGIARSVAAVAGGPQAPWPLLVTTADHVLLTPATIAAFLAGAGDADVAVGVVGEGVVTARFPATRRTWLRFRGGGWTGANLFLLRSARALPVLAAWSGVEQDRKRGVKLIAAFGPALLLRALTRTITLQDAVARAGAALGATVRAVPLDDPLAAVDVDREADLALAAAVLEGRA